MSVNKIAFYKIPFAILCVTCCTSVSYCQEEVEKVEEKIEIEKAIEEENVPKISSDFILNLFPDTKVDWYLDISGKDSTFEAKLKHSGRRYSVEFNQDGTVLNGQVDMSERELPGFVSDTIQAYLRNEFEKFELKKIQKQFKDKGDVMKAVMNKDTNDIEKQLEVKYEVVVFGIEKESQVYYEYIFDSDGIYIKRSKMEQSNNDNLFY